MSWGGEQEGSTSIPIACPPGGAGDGARDQTRSASFSLHGHGFGLPQADATPRSSEWGGGLVVDYATIPTQYEQVAPHWRRYRLRKLGPGAAAAVGRRLVQEVFGLFSGRNCYEAMPPSAQVVMIDITLPLKVAFVSAVENRVPFATIWDPRSEKLVGMMTVTDYIKVLLHRLRDPAETMRLEETPIWQWRQMDWMRRDNARDRPMIAASINDPVMTALRLLHSEAINRIPLLGADGTVLHVLNHSSLLDLLMTHLADLLPSADDEPLAGDTRMEGEPVDEDDAAAVASASLQTLFSYSVSDLGIGFYGTDMPVLTLEMPVHEVLELLLKHHRYSLPIVDAQKGRILDTFSRNDVIRLEQSGVYNIEQPLGQAIADRTRLDVPVFQASDSLGAVADLMSRAGARTLYCVDEDGRACGYLSVRQLFDWFMQYDEQ
eukprot:Hpha_TRINITY_DN13230_c0_g2::TRINITY_DN13230_c0_g2_i1::g.154964::m.154964/K07200/PRKAG; 5'-AMP-activated protein kinase, regulatory gamma subunit